MKQTKQNSLSQSTIKPNNPKLMKMYTAFTPDGSEAKVINAISKCFECFSDRPGKRPFSGVPLPIMATLLGSSTLLRRFEEAGVVYACGCERHDGTLVVDVCDHRGPKARRTEQGITIITSKSEVHFNTEYHAFKSVAWLMSEHACEYSDDDDLIEAVKEAYREDPLPVRSKSIGPSESASRASYKSVSSSAAKRTTELSLAGIKNGWTSKCMYSVFGQRVAFVRELTIPTNELADTVYVWAYTQYHQNNHVSLKKDAKERKNCREMSKYEFYNEYKDWVFRHECDSLPCSICGRTEVEPTYTRIYSVLQCMAHAKRTFNKCVGYEQTLHSIAEETQHYVMGDVREEVTVGLMDFLRRNVEYDPAHSDVLRPVTIDKFKIDSTNRPTTWMPSFRTRSRDYMFELYERYLSVFHSSLDFDVDWYSGCMFGAFGMRAQTVFDLVYTHKSGTYGSVFYYKDTDQRKNHVSRFPFYGCTQISVERFF